MIILASNSPRRRELLAHITRDFTVQGTDVDESLPAGIAPAAAVEQLSLRKALPLNNGAQIVIGADTVVAVDGMILGKPADEAEARQMLARLSGRWHSVFTGVSLVQGERNLTFSCETRVRFFDLTAAEIDAYIATGECMDKAGAYGIQGYGSLLDKFCLIFTVILWKEYGYGRRFTLSYKTQRRFCGDRGSNRHCPKKRH